MMLSNEQCIQVAEKVWRWNKYRIDDFQKENNLRDYINSWSGFGRTVEAMAERKYYFIADDIYIGFLHETKRHGDRNGPPDYFWSRQCPVISINDFIEEAHLAALEAIDAEGS